MKSTIDAVNHFIKWPNAAHAHNWIVYRRVGAFDNWSWWDDSELNETWQRVCTREQFEKCSIDMQRKPYEFNEHVSGEDYVNS
jgi:hypothetical protein